MHVDVNDFYWAKTQRKDVGKVHTKNQNNKDFLSNKRKPYAAMEMLAADMGLTSATSLAFCRASF